MFDLKIATRTTTKAESLVSVTSGSSSNVEAATPMVSHRIGHDNCLCCGVCVCLSSYFFLDLVLYCVLKCVLTYVVPM